MKKNLKSKRVNIVLVGITARNLGDPVIAANTRSLIQMGVPYFSRENYVVHDYNIYSDDIDVIKHADMVIFAGGGLIKFKVEEFYLHIEKILECAQENDIPVCFNSVGVEGFDPENIQCMTYRKILNYPCVKCITVRDNLDILKESYITNPDIKLYKVSDPAIFTSKVYQIKADKTSDTIGLGVARGQIFEDYGITNITGQYQLDFWRDLIVKIEEAGYKWKIFVNGMRADFDFANDLIEYLGYAERKEEFLVNRPVNTHELVETIASFKAIVACRMHANIIAYSLKIPSIGLVWNDKLKFWGESSGYPERFIEAENINADNVYNVLENALKEGLKQRGFMFKYSAFKPLRKFLHKYGKPVCNVKSKEETGDYNWNRILVAAALGGKGNQYNSMNCLEMIDEHYKDGYRTFEADIRLTKDEKIVCINGWTETMYNRMDLDKPMPGADGTIDYRLSYDEFMKCSMYNGHYAVTDIDGLMLKIKQYDGIKLILDAGKPGRDNVEKLANQLKEVYDKYTELFENITLRLQTRYDVECVRAVLPDINIMFYIPLKEQREAKNITVQNAWNYCKKQNIKWVSLSKEGFDDEIAPELAASKFKVLIFTYDNLTDVNEAFRRGADQVATNYLSVASVNLLTSKKMPERD